MRFDETTCSLHYSNEDQFRFCEIRDPVIWPAVLDAPSEGNRPGRWSPNVVVFTSAEDPEVQEELTKRLFPEPDVNEFTNSMNSDAVQNGEVLSSTGVILGTPERPRTRNYIEEAFRGTGPLILSSNCTRDYPGANAELLNEGIYNISVHAIPPTARNNSRPGNCTNIQRLYNTSAEIDRYLYCNFDEARCNATSEVFGLPYQRPDSEDHSPDQYTQAIDFGETSKDRLEVDVWVKDWGLEDTDRRRPTPRRLSQPINMIVNAWLKYASNNEHSRALLLGLQELPKPKTHRNLELSSLVAILLFTWVVQLLLPLMLVQVVYEKEQHLRIMVKMHGLGTAAYWLVTYFYYLVLYLLYSVILVAAGSFSDLAIFTRNDYGVLLVFLLLYGNAQIAFAFLLSNFLKTTRVCIVFSFLWIFSTGFIGLFLVARLISRNRIYVYFIELVPGFAAYRGFYELGEYGFRASRSNAQGLTWGSFDEDNNHMGYIMIVLFLESLFFLLLSWYLEQVLETGSGLARHPLFFMEYFKKTRKGLKGVGSDGLELSTNPAQGAPSRSSTTVVNLEVEEETVDEATERRRVESLTDEEAAEHSIIINKLRKAFPAYASAPEKVVVRGLTMAVRKGEVFGLLGPNGAGKTTTINMLIGFMSSTSGTASVEGHNIATEMETLYGLMGVCPQHNLLWKTLTGYEHLLFYGRLKGLKGDDLKQAVENALKEVELFYCGGVNKLVKDFSGGMKRRLCVAISLIGSPKVVYLDEPSTGLDPASKRILWRVIKAAKQNKAIVLTTHNMEEAEVLCDRLGIFVDGRLQVIGNSKNLSARYGGYLVFTLMTTPEDVSQATDLVRAAFPNSKRIHVVGGALKFELQSEEVSHSMVFQFVEEIAHKLRVLDWGVANVGLEEVFIQVAKAAGAKCGKMP